MLNCVSLYTIDTFTEQEDAFADITDNLFPDTEDPIESAVR